jgi:hypothetical protein
MDAPGRMEGGGVTWPVLSTTPVRVLAWPEACMAGLGVGLVGVAAGLCAGHGGLARAGVLSSRTKGGHGPAEVGCGGAVRAQNARYLRAL